MNKINDRDNTESLTQVHGWSAHCYDRGIMGPLFTSTLGKLYYLDVMDALGFIPVGPSDKVYRDE